MGQVMNKSKKENPTGEQAGKLADEIIKPIIDEVYKAELEPKKDVTYDDLYHAIFSVIQELRKKNGAMQFELPSKKDLEKAFNDCRSGSTGPLTKKECREIIGKMITLDKFSVGQGAIDILLYLFGIPICALMAKRIIPGIRSISDDVVIPIATSGSVIFLAKTNKL